MPKVLKRPQAETDLDEIWWFIAWDNADRFLDKIEERCQALAQFPHLGVSREELVPALQSLSVGNYLISYLPIEDGIEVAGMRDIAAMF
jgi:toxin ParE1/3/4